MVDNPPGAPIGVLIREVRVRKGLTQAAMAGRLAESSGNDSVNRGEVARWERGKRIPSRYWRHWIAIALEVSTVDLDRAAALAQFLRAAPEVAGAWAARQRVVDTGVR